MSARPHLVEEGVPLYGGGSEEESQARDDTETNTTSDSFREHQFSIKQSSFSNTRNNFKSSNALLMDKKKKSYRRRHKPTTKKSSLVTTLVVGGDGENKEEEQDAGNNSGCHDHYYHPNHNYQDNTPLNQYKQQEKRRTKESSWGSSSSSSDNSDDDDGATAALSSNQNIARPHLVEEGVPLYKIEEQQSSHIEKYGERVNSKGITSPYTTTNAIVSGMSSLAIAAQQRSQQLERTNNNELSRKPNNAIFHYYSNQYHDYGAQSRIGNTSLSTPQRSNMATRPHLVVEEGVSLDEEVQQDLPGTFRPPVSSSSSFHTTNKYHDCCARSSRLEISLSKQQRNLARPHLVEEGVSLDEVPQVVPDPHLLPASSAALKASTMNPVVSEGMSSLARAAAAQRQPDDSANSTNRNHHLSVLAISYDETDHQIVKQTEQIDVCSKNGPLVVMDGANVSYAYSTDKSVHQPDTRGLIVAANYFLSLPTVRVLVVIPRQWLESSSSLNDDNLIPLLQLQREKKLVVVPPDGDDDAYALSIARHYDDMYSNQRHHHDYGGNVRGGSCSSFCISGGFILSNDFFNDAIERDDDDDDGASSSLEKWLERHRIGFSFYDIGSRADEDNDRVLDIQPDPNHPLVNRIEKRRRKHIFTKRRKLKKKVRHVDEINIQYS